MAIAETYKRSARIVYINTTDLQTRLDCELRNSATSRLLVARSHSNA